jgi:hypothetical protein
MVAAGAIVGAGACGGDTRVEIVVSLEPGVPLEGLEVVALPYDHERLLDSLAALAPTPRPEFPALEVQLLAFKRPEYREDDAAVRAWSAVRDSLRQLSDSLTGIDRRSPGYAAAYDRFRRLYERFLEKTAARDAGVRELTAEVRDLAVRAGRAADSLRGWEQEAYAGADSAARLAQAATGRPAVWGASDSAGRVSLTLGRGAWWLHTQVPHPENPFLEYRWRTAVVAAGLPFRVPFSRLNAVPAWRH